MTSTGAKRKRLPHKFFVDIGATGGAATGGDKAEASRKNGKLGGRPAVTVKVMVGGRELELNARTAWAAGLPKNTIEFTPGGFGYHRIASAWTPNSYATARNVICGKCGDLRKITHEAAQRTHDAKHKAGKI